MSKGKPVEIWFQTRCDLAEKGIVRQGASAAHGKPSGDQRYESASLFGAIARARQRRGLACPMRHRCLQLQLDEISPPFARGRMRLR